MTAADLYHVGVLVMNLEMAIDNYTNLLGVRFDRPITRRVDGLREDGRDAAERDLRITYSLEEPPYLELIEAQPDGICGRQHGEGIHHVGAWQPGLEQRWAELVRQGHRAEARIHNPGGSLRVVYLDDVNPRVHGVRFELLLPGEIPRSTPDDQARE